LTHALLQYRSVRQTARRRYQHFFAQDNEQIERALNSIGDNRSFLLDNLDPV
jgi:hypothetical protein